jgi:hypothetical protein
LELPLTVFIIYKRQKGEKMKKIVLFVIVSFLLVIILLKATNTDPFEEPYELSREYNLSNLNIELERIEPQTQPVHDIPNLEEIDISSLFERRNYILNRLNSEEKIEVDLYLNYDLVCTWNLGSVPAWDRGEDLLYFAQVNCPAIEEEVVTWYVHQNYAEYRNKELQVWTLKEGEYNLLPIK